MAKYLIAGAVILCICGALLIGGLVYMGSVGPETFVVSDALVDIREGMYSSPTRSSSSYCSGWEDPLFVEPFSELVDVDVEYDESFFVDSYISVTTSDGEQWGFPVSSERGMDEVFYEYLLKKIEGSGG